MRNDHVRWRNPLVCTLFGASAVLTVLVALGWGPLLSLDGWIARGLHSYAVSHPGVTRLMRVLSDWVWDPWTMRALAGAVCLWLWWRGRGRCALRIAVATVAASVVSQGLKFLVGRERPVWPDPVVTADYASYPSGHALTATTVCGLLGWLAAQGSARPAAQSLPRERALPRPALALLVALAAVSVLGVGFTRIYLGVHWFSDVVAGWLLGAVLVALAVSDGACSGRSPVSPRAGGPAR
ncbi:phosphatase PAP2 family protein [Streptomyces sp. NBC_01264]|uniref:phosphatase PAP2 family protein n=1 Tax=Streptomyces sp. NBC_01264 TaxID=2903804 RepID=UPI002254D3EB|nr:phosphatase PAP2 family protein [Streptomyces sp. NBC_01264]MCX4776517.1 phosphatase PAP2 family protein [Streptomyces sp. NBC_01264]